VSGVLVTGATTPFGRALVDSLLAQPQGGHVLAVGIEVPERAGFPTAERLTYLQVDLTRPRSIRQLLFGPARDLGIHAIVHGPLHRRVMPAGPKAEGMNVGSTRELLRLAERHPTIRRFVMRSHAGVYRVDADQPSIIGEEQPLQLATRMPQALRDRLEADVTVCMRMGMSPLHIVVLRFAEILAPDCGSQLFDYLRSRVCFRPLGFDPMVHVMTIDDAVRATVLALGCPKQGIFNVGGKDVLPLSLVIARAGRTEIPVPGPLLAPLYGLRSRVIHSDFRYDLNRLRFHWSGVLDGRRARDELGYEPQKPVEWGAISAAVRRPHAKDGR
jgi:UDP-glucose 4-epimerase